MTNNLGRIPRLGVSNFAVPEVTSFEPGQSPEMFSISESVRKRRPQRRPSSSTPRIARPVNPHGRCVRKNEINILANKTRVQIIGRREGVVYAGTVPSSAAQVPAAVGNAAIQRDEKTRGGGCRESHHRSRGSAAARPLLRASGSGSEPLWYQLVKWVRTRLAKSREDSDSFATNF